MPERRGTCPCWIRDSEPVRDSKAKKDRAITEPVTSICISFEVQFGTEDGVLIVVHFTITTLKLVQVN